MFIFLEIFITLSLFIVDNQTNKRFDARTISVRSAQVREIFLRKNQLDLIIIN